MLRAVRARVRPVSPRPAELDRAEDQAQAQATELNTTELNTTEHDKAEELTQVSEPAQAIQAEHSINPLAALEQPYIHPPKPDYISVPETAFTRFTLELTDPAQITPYTGDQGTLESGGIVIHTPMVFRVGDEIQIQATISGEELISFEAPIQWVESPEDPRDLFGGGVVVGWPALSAHQLNEVTQALSGVETLFYG